MRGLSCVLLLAACATPPRVAREVSPSALKGVSLALPPPTDLRGSPGAGCGQVATDLPLQTEKALVDAFSKAGAKLTVSGAAPWTLTVAVITATVGAAYVGSPNASARPTAEPQPDVPDVLARSGSLFNGDNGNATVTLEGTLARGGTMVWRGTTNGHAGSVPCQDVRPKIREALVEAVEGLRDAVIAQVGRAAK